MLEPPRSKPSVPPASAEATSDVLPPEHEVATPGAVLVIDEAGKLRDRSPRALGDPELGALVTGSRVPPALLEGVATRPGAGARGVRHLVHEGSSLDAVWLARDDAALAAGLGERDLEAMLHRLRGIVATIVASLDTEDMLGSGPASAQVGNTRRREVDRLVGALTTLGHAFTSNAGRSFVDLELVLRRAIDGLRGGAKRRDVTLQLDGARDARRPRSGDETLLTAAIVALVENAIDASPSGGIVRIAVEASMASVRIAIEDDGPGLLKPRRGEPGTPFVTSKRGGLGLGLVVARRAAFVHGGELCVATRERGTGTIASFWLPMAMG
jgi:signal transduction histidine kinase